MLQDESFRQQVSELVDSYLVYPELSQFDGLSVENRHKLVIVRASALVSHLHSELGPGPWDEWKVKGDGVESILRNLADDIWATAAEQATASVNPEFFVSIGCLAVEIEGLIDYLGKGSESITV